MRSATYLQLMPLWVVNDKHTTYETIVYFDRVLYGTDYFRLQVFDFHTRLYTVSKPIYNSSLRYAYDVVNSSNSHASIKPKVCQEQCVFDAQGVNDMSIYTMVVKESISSTN